MATVHGGRALGLPLGRLRRGQPADFLVVDAAAGPAATLAAFVSGECRLREVRIGGRMVLSRHRPAAKRVADGQR
jgi:cytosine/adenosine deaminase-related metal-dependent hydrolase